MIIDFHTHIFPKDIRENREKLFPAEPAFKLLYQSAKSRLIGAADLIDAMDKNRVDKSVVFGFPWKNSAVFTAAQRLYHGNGTKISRSFIRFRLF